MASTLPLVLVMTAVVAANENALKVFVTEKLVLEAVPRVELLEFILFVVRLVGVNVVVATLFVVVRPETATLSDSPLSTLTFVASVEVLLRYSK